MSARPARQRARAQDTLRVQSALMKRLAAGDLEALGELYDLHSEDVRRFVRRATGNTDVADDLTHEAFLTLTDVAHRYDGVHPVRNFIVGIAAQLVRRRHRRVSNRLRHLMQLRAAALPAFERTPEDETTSREQLDRFRVALGRLSEAKRLVFLLADVEGLTGKEIAAALGIPLATVWTRLHYARAKLRRVLAPAPSVPARADRRGTKP